MSHDESCLPRVLPGGTGEIAWTFDRAGTFGSACLFAGRCQSGMVGTIHVATA